MKQQLTLGTVSRPPTGYAPLPNRSYSIIYADPPWAYRDKAMNRTGAERHYRTVGIDKLCQLPVQNIAAPVGTVLFLWATWPTLPDALRLIQAWGFQYKTLGFVWIKTTKDGARLQIGGGAYTRANSEICLLATRGSILPRLSRNVRQVIHQVGIDILRKYALNITSQLEDLILEAIGNQEIIAPRLEHSAKPPEARDRIVQLFGDAPRIELFARETAPGWDCWGDEV